MLDARRADARRFDSATLARGLARAWAAVRWYVTSMMGDTAYATYAAHHERRHPGEPVMDERAFWRDRSDAQDRNPAGRCC
jgi:uncharacterized short protein YbdD (DUF466 family)